MVYHINYNISLYFRKESLVVVEQKTANNRIAQLKIKEERNLGSLTCHVLRNLQKPVFKHFSANASTRFSNAGTYDPYRYCVYPKLCLQYYIYIILRIVYFIFVYFVSQTFSFGTKRTRLFNCDIFLVDTAFDDPSVDLEVNSNIEYLYQLV